MFAFLILKLLRGRELYPSEISRELEKISGKRPSPGTIYPLLKRMWEKGLVKAEKRKGRKVYKITKRGIAFLEEILEKKEELFFQIERKIKELVELDKKYEVVLKLLSNMKELLENYEKNYEFLNLLREYNLKIIKKYKKRKKEVLKWLKKEYESF